MKDLSELHHFLGITMESRSQGLFLHQHQYIVDILERASMADCKPCTTPVDTQGKAFDDDDPNYSQYKYISQPWLGLGFQSN